MRAMELDASLYKHLLDHVYDGVYFVDTNRRILYWNKGAERITGYSAEEVIGSRCADNILVHVDENGVELCTGTCPLLQATQDTRNHHAEVYLHHKSGHRIPVSVYATALRNADGQVIGCIETFRESVHGPDPLYIYELEKASLLDPLTQIANRRFLEMRLASSIAEFRRYAIPFGIIFADIDRFKEINDTHGHLAGDEMLKMIARSLCGNVRSTDLVGRWGGEEFLIIASHASLRSLQNLALKLRALIQKSFLRRDDLSLQVTMTFGATIVRPEDTEQTVIARADALMYRGKTDGRNRVIAEA